MQSSGTRRNGRPPDKKHRQHGCWYQYGGAGHGDRLLEERDHTGAVQARYLYGTGFAPVVAELGDGGLAPYFVHTDHLDTPRMLTDAAGEVAWQADYWAFGEAVVVGSPAVEFNIRFPGQYYDAETGLHYNRFRYYDPSIGRYISADPIGQAGGTNLYDYVGNNPALVADPLGLSPGYFSRVASNVAVTNTGSPGILAPTGTGVTLRRPGPPADLRFRGHGLHLQPRGRPRDAHRRGWHYPLRLRRPRQPTPGDLPRWQADGVRDRRPERASAQVGVRRAVHGWSGGSATEAIPLCPHSTVALWCLIARQRCKGESERASSLSSRGPRLPSARGPVPDCG